MAVRDDFTAGEVLAAADLNDTFASKLPYSYGTATPSTTIDGFVWFDENTTPPTPKYWDGSAFQTFSAGPADFSDAATGTYTDTGISYKYITFTASGTLTVTKAGFADVLVVGGGAAGGARVGAGGGAGGHLYITDAYLPAGTATVTVGAGGAAFTPASDYGVQGQVGVASRIGSYFSPGGGGGGVTSWAIASSNQYSTPGSNGGSGGGSGGFATGSAATGGLGISGIGNDGGDAAGTNGAGGGGGAGAAGSNGSNNTGGAGGAGTANSITGTSVTRAGGGGGSGGTTHGAGGSGGGGAGGAASATSGTANTGGGGGGVFNSATAAGSGGSGVVIVRVRT